MKRATIAAVGVILMPLIALAGITRDDDGPSGLQYNEVECPDGFYDGYTVDIDTGENRWILKKGGEANDTWIYIPMDDPSLSAEETNALQTAANQGDANNGIDVEAGGVTAVRTTSTS